MLPTAPMTDNTPLQTIRQVAIAPGWHTVTDHTGDANGYFMIINASEQPSDFFVQTVTGLCDGTTYKFSAWILNMDSSSGILPNVTFTIETTSGTILQTYSTGNVPIISKPTWTQYGFYFTTSAGLSTVVLRMHNNAPGGVGNDLALDDIQFRPAGPQTLATVQGSPATVLNICSYNDSLIFDSEIVGNCYLNTAYQWQVSTDSINWTNIAGATIGTYTLPSLTPGTYYYRLEVAQADNIGSISCTVFSNPIKIIFENLIPTIVNTEATICNGQNYTLPSGRIVNTTGLYNDTLRTMGGCDSVVTNVNLSVIIATISNINASICKGNFYTFPSGNTANIGGLYK